MLPNLYFQNEVKSLTFLKGTDKVIYVGPVLPVEQRTSLRAIDHSVIFVHDVLSKLSKEILEYNFPGIKLPEGFSVEYICGQIRSELECPTDSQHMMLIHYEHGNYNVYDALLDFSKLEWYLTKIKDKKSAQEERPHFKIGKIHCCKKFAFELYDNIDEELKEEEIEREEKRTDHTMFSTKPSKVIRNESLSLNEPDIRFRVTATEEPKKSDQRFSEEMTKAAAEIEKMVKDLLLQGFPAEIVQSWLNESVKLSRLRITRQFKILLVDYDMEIKMGPLPKTVFLFYLRHPEGVKFTYLQDHVDELRRIYGHVSVNDDPIKMNESIASLIDPLNNSICEKCAAIKKAFMLKVNDNVAKNYYITGMQGGEKGIRLDRNLVEWECEL